MARALPPEHQDLSLELLRIVRQKKECDLDELLQECASYMWTQVFLEVDRLVAPANCAYCPKEQ